MEQQCRSAILEGVAIAGFQIGFGRRALGIKDRVVGEFDVVIGDRMALDLTNRFDIRLRDL
ncbi:hypothetical protein L2A60_08030 [Acidiphilium iwatense]|uniref:Uncharacterized protein n=1 Tax=Acidiphilium iwatense TaxID=768198 RepID=A0ABS9DVA5_9PROT|nr:hypothetical protein [Acidiphilium iwatense]